MLQRTSSDQMLDLICFDQSPWPSAFCEHVFAHERKVFHKLSCNSGLCCSSLIKGFAGRPLLGSLSRNPVRLQGKCYAVKRAVSYCQRSEIPEIQKANEKSVTGFICEKS